MNPKIIALLRDHLSAESIDRLADLSACSPEDLSALADEVALTYNDVDPVQNMGVVAALGRVMTAISERREVAEPEGEPVVPSTRVVQTPPGTPTARTTSLAALVRATPASRPGSRPLPASRTSALALTASGQAVETREALAEEFEAALRAMTMSGEKRRVVASGRWKYPEGRRLGEDVHSNGALIASIGLPDSLVAAGGLCAPLPALFDAPVVGEVSRPVRDALVAVEATRGGVRYVTPPKIGDVSGASGIWTEATDQNPGANVKPTLQMDCGTEVKVVVDAITSGVKVGNLASRFAPERLASVLRLVMVASARTAENNLLSRMGSLSTAATTAADLGASRDLLTAVELAAVALRSRHRLAPDALIDVVLPSWARGLLRSDLTRAMPGDRRTSVTDAEVDEHLTVRGIRPIYSMDAQGFGAQTAGAALTAWPATVSFFAYPSGSFVFLDGGTLDLGIVRDSTLNATNNMIVFSETFEGVALRGPESLKVSATVTPNGLVGPQKAPPPPPV